MTGDANLSGRDQLARKGEVERALAVDMYRRSLRSLPTLLALIYVMHALVGEAVDRAPTLRAIFYALSSVVVLRVALLLVPERCWPGAGSSRDRLRFGVFLAGAALTASGIGCIDILSYDTLDPPRVALLVLVNAGIISGAITSLSSSPVTYITYIAPPFAALIAMLLRDSRPWPKHLLAAAWAIWVVFLVLQVFDYRRSRFQALALNLDLDDKVRELDDKNRSLEQAHRETERKNAVLALANDRLIESNARADRIFNALAEALPGTVLDSKFQLETRIGRGGFSVVFRGMHLSLRRPVAIKIFRPQRGNDSAVALERFRMEGVSVSKLTHPNIVHVFDSGTSGEGLAYIVMELLDGESLREELSRSGLLTLQRAAQILAPICDALATAHAAGVVHRDIKPENVFLHRAPQGEVVKLVDFGIAKVTELELDDSHNLTRTGALLGTPAFMAPERLQGRESDASGDVFSVGVLIYHMLTGRFPFEGTLSEIMVEALTETPRTLVALQPRIPEAISNLVASALERDPSRRPAAAELGRTFVAAVEALPEAVRTEVFPPVTGVRALDETWAKPDWVGST